MWWASHRVILKCANLHYLNKTTIFTVYRKRCSILEIFLKYIFNFLKLFISNQKQRERERANLAWDIIWKLLERRNVASRFIKHVVRFKKIVFKKSIDNRSEFAMRGKITDRCCTTRMLDTFNASLFTRRVADLRAMFFQRATEWNLLLKYVLPWAAG